MAAIIFDMDGTIADSFDYVASFMATEAGIKRLTDEQKQSLRGLSMAAMARQLGYHWWNAPRLFFKGRSRMHQAINHVKAFAGINELIHKLQAEGHELFILSTNSKRNINHFIKEQGTDECFTEIYGGVGIFGKGPALRRLLKQQSLEIDNAVYVGDELRDVQAANSIGLRVVAVSWGFARRNDLVAAKPLALADSPADLMKILEEI